jgi:hypothetical protein
MTKSSKGFSLGGALINPLYWISWYLAGVLNVADSFMVVAVAVLLLLFVVLLDFCVFFAAGFLLLSSSEPVLVLSWSLVAFS